MNKQYICLKKDVRYADNVMNEGGKEFKEHEYVLIVQKNLIKHIYSNILRN